MSFPITTRYGRDPTLDQELATKKYVDDNAGVIEILGTAEVTAATVTEIELTGSWDLEDVYAYLLAVFTGVTDASNEIELQLDGDTSASYDYQRTQQNAGTPTELNIANATSAIIAKGNGTGAQIFASVKIAKEHNLDNYTYLGESQTGGVYLYKTGGILDTVDAGVLTSVKFLASANNILIRSRLTLYGIKSVL